MNFICDYIEFKDRTKPIRDAFDLDIVPDIGLGFFFPDRLDELKQYCIDHPQYHIMSLLPLAMKANKVIPSALYYLLAEGDPDPDLWYRIPMSEEVLQSLEIFKFDRK